MTSHETEKPEHKKSMRIIRNVYLYLVAIIGLITFIFGAVGMINNVFQNYVFRVDYDYYSDPMASRAGYGCSAPYVDATDLSGKKMIQPTSQDVAKCEESQEKQREQNRNNRIGSEFSIAIAQLGVGLPIWLFHWGIIQKEYRKKDEEIS